VPTLLPLQWLAIKAGCGKADTLWQRIGGLVPQCGNCHIETAPAGVDPGLANEGGPLMCKNRVLTLSFAALVAGVVSVAAGGRSFASADPTAAAATCIDEGADGDLDEFTKCWAVNMMSDDQRRVAQCIAVNKGLGGAAFCMSGMQLSPFGLQVAKCAQRHSGDARAIAGCIGLPVLPPQGQRLAACVAVNPQNYWGAALCAGGHELTPEQTIFANCAVATGLQPRGLIVCISGRVTMDELQKCLNLTVARDRCFGDADDVTQLACEAWRGIAAESVPNQPPQIFGGARSAFHNPGRLAAGPNSAVDNPGELAGGANAVARNPDQAPGNRPSLSPKTLAARF